MCQITAYLNDEKIMEGVMLVEPIENGVRLSTMFDKPQEVQAKIQKLDLYRNKLYLEGEKGDHEING